VSHCQYSVITLWLLLSSNSLQNFIYSYHTIMSSLCLKVQIVYIFKRYIIFIYYNTSIKYENRKSLLTFLSVFFYIYLEFNVNTSCIFHLIIYYYYLVIVWGSFYYNDYTETASHCICLSINIYMDYYNSVVFDYVLLYRYLLY